MYESHLISAGGNATPTTTHYTNVIDVGDKPTVNLARAESAARAFLVRYRVDNTRRTYGLALRQWFGWCVEHDLDPLEATRAHIELFARELERTGRCKGTVAGKLNVLGVFYKLCVIDELIVRDPTLSVRRPNVEHKSRSTLFSRGEVVDMLAKAEASSPQDHALIAVLAHHGLRIGETLAMDVEDIVEQRGQMAAQIIRKGGDSQLIVFVPEVAFILRKHLANRPDNGPIFRTRTGRRMDRKSAGNVIKRIAKAAGVTKRAHPHAFRKTMATISRNAGVPDREIIAAAGWKSPAMLGYYDGGKETLQSNAAMQLAAFLDRAA